MKLTKHQKAIFDEVMKSARGVVSKSRAQKIEAYAIERARWVDAEQAIKDEGETHILRNDKGVVIKVIESPMLKIAARAQDRALKLAQEIGL